MNMYYLPLNLQFFAEEASDQSSAETKNPDKVDKEHMIPKSRFDEVNHRFKEAQSQLEQFTAEKEASEKKSAEEQGKFQELYEATSKELYGFKSKYQDVEKRSQELESVVKSLLQTKLEAIPDEFHDLIPDNLSIEGKLDWINKAEAKGLFGKRPQQPVGEMTNGTEYSGITKEQFAKMSYAERSKVYSTNPDLYKKLSR
jgi:hypothetical protein